MHMHSELCIAVYFSLFSHFYLQTEGKEGQQFHLTVEKLEDSMKKAKREVIHVCLFFLSTCLKLDIQRQIPFNHAQAKFFIQINAMVALFILLILDPDFFLLTVIKTMKKQYLSLCALRGCLFLSGDEHPSYYTDEPPQPPGWDLHPQGDDCFLRVCPKVCLLHIDSTQEV